MKPKRRRGNSPAKEGWNQRLTSLDDFFTIPVDSLSQQTIIELSSSSSSDEDEACAKPKRRIPKMQTFAPASFPQEFENSSHIKKLEVVKVSSSKINTTPRDKISKSKKTLNYQSESCYSPPSLYEPAGDEKDTCIKDVVKLDVHNTRGLLSEAQSSRAVKTTVSDTSEENSGRMSKCLSPGLSVSCDVHAIMEPISPVLKSSTTSAGRLENQEPNSPVIGSSQRCFFRRVHRNQNIRKRVHSAIVNNVTPENNMSPVLKSHMTDLNASPVLSTKATDPCKTLIFSPNHSEISNNTRAEFVQSRVRPRNLLPELNWNEASSCESPLDNRILSQEDPELEEVMSQASVDVTEEQTDIDIIESPSKYSQCASATVSKGSEEPCISSVSTTPKEDDAKAEEDSKAGFSWIKAVQERTPEKSDCQSAQFVESSTKRKKKDGHSGRLRRLINSWRSDVNMWVHENLIGKLKFKAPKLDEATLKMSSPGCVIKRELQCDKLSPGFGSSPGIRNLQNIFFESPHSSSNIAKPSMDSSPHSQKFLRLRILEVGGSLQSNAALCEAHLECTGESQEKLSPDSSHKLPGPVRYLTFFSFVDHSISPNLSDVEEVEVYPPWTVLDVSPLLHPVLFTSFFKICKKPNIENMSVLKEEEKNESDKVSKRHNSVQSKVKLKKEILLEWSCNCRKDCASVPSVCNLLQLPANSQRNTIIKKRKWRSSIRVLKNNVELQENDPHQASTISAAVEKSKGISNIQVDILIHVHRSISCRNAEHEVEKWKIIVQDTNGMFCVIKIPNRPLVKDLKKFIEGGEGHSFILTDLHVVDRLTDSQDPGLFNFISFLHNFYVKALRSDSSLYASHKDHISQVAQTFCYIFEANLGVTKALNCDEDVGIYISSPSYLLCDLIQCTPYNERANIRFQILFKKGNFFYVMDKTEESVNAYNEEKSSKTYLRNFSGNKKFVVSKIEINRKTVLPVLIEKNTTVLKEVIIKDIAIWHGNVIIDDYSTIEVLEDVNISMSKLVKILRPLSNGSHYCDLVIVSGTIQYIDEETATTWWSCLQCKNEVENSSIRYCSSCKLRDPPVKSQYFMEIGLKTTPDAYIEADIKVKLCQATIEKLLKMCQQVDSEDYSANMLIGQSVGPMISILERVYRPLGKQHKYLLVQLPY